MVVAWSRADPGSRSGSAVGGSVVLVADIGCSNMAGNDHRMDRKRVAWGTLPAVIQPSSVVSTNTKRQRQDIEVSTELIV